MKIPRSDPRFGVGFNMTPMIDIVFQLLIFFLVSNHLAKLETQMDLPLPVATSGQERATDARHTVINVRDDGSYVFAGRYVALDELRRRLADSKKESSDDLEIRIRGDRRVLYQFVEPLLRACAEAGIWNVTFAVYRPGDAP